MEVLAKVLCSWTRTSALALVVVLSTGCAVNRYQAPIGKFRVKVQDGVTVLSDFYNTRNSYERDLYLLGISLDSDLEVGTTDQDGNRTALGSPVFSEESIKARLDALRLVGIYGNRLAELAGSEAPANFQDAATLLGTNLVSLEQTFRTLANNDSTAGSFIGPISRLIGAIGNMILQAQRDRLIVEAVTEATEPVRTILDLVRTDLNTIFSIQVATGQSQIVADLIIYYNDNRTTMSYEERRDFLSTIAGAYEGLQMAVVASPTALIDAISRAHEALIKLANSPRARLDFTEFNDALEEMAARIEVIAGEIRTLRSL